MALADQAALVDPADQVGNEVSAGPPVAVALVELARVPVDLPMGREGQNGPVALTDLSSQSTEAIGPPTARSQPRQSPPVKPC